MNHMTSRKLLTINNMPISRQDTIPADNFMLWVKPENIPGLPNPIPPRNEPHITLEDSETTPRANLCPLPDPAEADELTSITSGVERLVSK